MKTVEVPIDWFIRLLEIKKQLPTELKIESLTDPLANSEMSYLMGYIESAKIFIKKD